jgi:hypothetical protein
VRRFSRIMHAGGNPVAWFYEVRDSNNVVAAMGKGFDTDKAAMAAGRKKRLPHSGCIVEHSEATLGPDLVGGKLENCREMSPSFMKHRIAVRPHPDKFIRM